MTTQFFRNVVFDEFFDGVAGQLLGFALPPSVGARLLLFQLRIEAALALKLQAPQRLAGFCQGHRTELAEPDLAQCAVMRPVTVEKHAGGIRAAHPQSQVIGIGALVSRTQVGDNATCEPWCQNLHFDCGVDLCRHLHQID